MKSNPSSLWYLVLLPVWLAILCSSSSGALPLLRPLISKVNTMCSSALE